MWILLEGEGDLGTTYSWACNFASQISLPKWPYVGGPSRELAFISQ